MALPVFRTSSPYVGLKDEIVVSGISGAFPACENLSDYERNLYDGVNMILPKNDRWPSGKLDSP